MLVSLAVMKGIWAVWAILGAAEIGWGRYDIRSVPEFTNND